MKSWVDLQRPLQLHASPKELLWVQDDDPRYPAPDISHTSESVSGQLHEQHIGTGHVKERVQPNLSPRMYQQDRQHEQVTAKRATIPMLSKQNSGKEVPAYRQDSQDTQLTKQSGTSPSLSQQDGENSVHGPRQKSPAPRSKLVGIIEGVGMFKQPSNDAAMSPPGKAKALGGGRKTESQPGSPRAKPLLRSEEDSTHGLSGDALSTAPSDRGSWVGTYRFGITDRTFKGIDDSSP